MTLRWNSVDSSRHTGREDTLNTSWTNTFIGLHCVIRMTSRHKRKRENGQKKLLVTTYNHPNPYFMGMIRRYWPIIESSRTLSRVFPEESMTVFRSYKKPEGHIHFR